MHSALTLTACTCAIYTSTIAAAKLAHWLTQFLQLPFRWIHFKVPHPCTQPSWLYYSILWDVIWAGPITGGSTPSNIPPNFGYYTYSGVRARIGMDFVMQSSMHNHGSRSVFIIWLTKPWTDNPRMLRSDWIHFVFLNWIFCRIGSAFRVTRMGIADWVES